VPNLLFPWKPTVLIGSLPEPERIGVSGIAGLDPRQNRHVECIQSTEIYRGTLLSTNHSRDTSIDTGSNWIRKPVSRGAPIHLIVNDIQLPAFEGESLGVALATAGHLQLRSSPTLGKARGMFCLMGVCQECVVEVDGKTRPACMVLAQDGMRINTDNLNRQSGTHNSDECGG
jgi:hypothetical protein